MSPPRQTSPVHGEVSRRDGGVVENPCTRDCPNRHPHCHSDCEPYLAYYAWRREENEKSLRDKELDAMRLEGINKAVRYARVMRGKLH